MGFFDFFKRKRQEAEEIEVEEIELSEIGDWLSRKKDRSKEKEKEFLSSIYNRTSQLIQDLEEQIKIVEQVNVDERKIDERTKLIVKENLNNYIDYVKKLINNLKELNVDSELIKKLNLVFSDFEKKSIMSFQKATFVIGDEVGKIREDIVHFSRDFKNILENNKNLIRELNILSFVEDKLKKIAEVNNLGKEIERDIENSQEEIKKTETLSEVDNNKIKEIENSNEYLEEQEKQKELDKKELELEGKMQELKQMIDFKQLSNDFHSNEKEMKIIREYRENFNETFSKDYGSNLVDLIKNPEEILEKIELIEQLENEIKDVIIKNLTKDLELERKRLNSSVEDLKNNIQKHEKRYEKLSDKMEEIKKLIKQELLKINVGIKQ